MSRFNPRDIHTERLSTTDEKGNRVYLYPEAVRGFFRTLRHYIFTVLIFIYLIVPWTNVGGEQTLLLDIAHRKFIIFGHVFWGHDAPLLIFLFLGLGFTTALVTALWGRVWCGYACPQTVFVDFIYRKIEILVEGKVRDRILLEESPYNLSKIIKKIIKWSLFIIISSLIAHSFLGYFVGTKNLWYIVTHNPSENWTLFTIMLILTGLFAFDFGWFREQFCIIACPYGRLQGVLMDQNTYHVAYDTNRSTDCINCYRCVAVCPTGIDIRRGTQLECIGCAQCVDACDEIMLKVKKPTKLIRYDSENGLKGKVTKLLRPRTVIYFSVLLAIVAVFSVTLKKEQELKTLWIRSSTPFTIQGEMITNQFKLELFYPKKIELNFQSTNPQVQLITPSVPFKLQNERKSDAIIFLKFPRSLLKDGTLLLKVDILHQNQKLITTEVKLVGPLN